MDEREFELEKIRIAETARQAQLKSDMFKWFVMLVWPPVSQLLIAYAANSITVLPAVRQVAEKADTAATVAVETKKTTDTIATAADASVKSWRAYQTKDSADMEIAERAVAAAAPE